MRQLIKVVFVWIQFTLVFDYTIIIFIYFERIKFHLIWKFILLISFKWFHFSLCYCLMEFMVIIYVIKGKIFSLHILQYQSAPVLTTVNSSQENWVQFLWTFLWQQLQSIKYECYRIFFLTYGISVFLVIHDDFWESLKWLYSKEYCSGGRGWQQCEFSQPLTPNTPLLIKFGKGWFVQLAQKWQDCKMCVAT